jgi:NAD+ synthase (glutamine-hydrolysing)
VRIGLAQINSFLGNFEENYKKILDFTKRAKDHRCELVVFPEAALFGYHPVDLLERESIVHRQLKYLDQLHKNIPKDIKVIVGAITVNSNSRGKPFFNSAVVLEKGKKMKVCSKELLPAYDVFDEGRHIESGTLKKNVIRHKGSKILISICEDIWGWKDRTVGERSIYPKNPVKDLKPKDVDLVLNLSASPFTKIKRPQRLDVCKRVISHLRAPLVYVNMVGGQDEIVFDGGSFALDKKGKLIAQSSFFEEDLNVVDFSRSEGGVRDIYENEIEAIRSALVLGLKDFVYKTGFKKVHLGLSGGIDSAVVACVAADAVGPQNVTLIGLPGPYTSEMSLSLSRSFAKNLGAHYKEASIDGVFKESVTAIEKTFGAHKFGLAHENLQARSRGMMLMAFSNLHSSLLLNTSNKSEIAMGYSTLYGDQVGGICVIGDLLKGQVYELARAYNAEYELIPQDIIDRPPTAELREGQKDSDTLPPYDELDRAVEKLVEGSKPPRGELEKRVLKALMESEFKRWQAPPVLKVTHHAFGRGRRFPVAHAARH